MAAFSDYLAENILNTILRGSSFISPPTNTYIALFTASPTDAGSLTAELTSINSPGYARVAVSSSGGWSSPTPSGGNISSTNNNALEFAQATGNWVGPITYAALLDAASGGNMLWFGALASPRTIGTGDVLRFSAGALTVQLT